ALASGSQLGTTAYQPGAEDVDILMAEAIHLLHLDDTAQRLPLVDGLDVVVERHHLDERWVERVEQLLRRPRVVPGVGADRIDTLAEGRPAERDDAGADVAVPLIPQLGSRASVHRRQLCVERNWLLEMRDDPEIVAGAAMKPAIELVPDAAAHKRVERGAQPVSQVVRQGTTVVSIEQGPEEHRVGVFRRLGQPTATEIDALPQPLPPVGRHA